MGGSNALSQISRCARSDSGAPDKDVGMRIASANWRHFDFWLLGAVAVLTIFGITMIPSAVAGNIELAELDLVRRQLIFVIVGFAIVPISASLDYHLWAA